MASRLNQRSPISMKTVADCSGMLDDEALVSQAFERRIETYQTLFDFSSIDPMTGEELPISADVMPDDQPIEIMQRALAMGHPIAISARLPDEMNLLDEDFSHIGLPLSEWISPEGEVDHAYHAMFIFGYDPVHEEFMVQNSWGKDWGNGGIFTLSFDAAKKTLLSAYIAYPREPEAQYFARCAMGEISCSGQDIVERCPDGNENVITTCAEGSVCVENGDSASCQSECLDDTFFCGVDAITQRPAVFYQCEDRIILDEVCQQECVPAEYEGGFPVCDPIDPVKMNNDPMEMNNDPMSMNNDPMTMNNDPMMPEGPAFEVRIEWLEDLDLDLVVEVEGEGTYSYSGVPPMSTGQFENERSCYNNRPAYCQGQLSEERVFWTDVQPAGDISLHVINWDGSDGEVPVVVTATRFGEEVYFTDLFVPAESRAKSEVVEIAVMP